MSNRQPRKDAFTTNSLKEEPIQSNRCGSGLRWHAESQPDYADSLLSCSDGEKNRPAIVNRHIRDGSLFGMNSAGKLGL